MRAYASQPFFESMHRALRPGGIVCTQGECVWLHLDLIKRVSDLFREARTQRRCTPRRCVTTGYPGQVFVGGTVSYAYTSIPTYPSGQIGFMLCSKAGDSCADFLAPQRPPPQGSRLLRMCRVEHALMRGAALQTARHWPRFGITIRKCTRRHLRCQSSRAACYTALLSAVAVIHDVRKSSGYGLHCIPRWPPPAGRLPPTGAAATD